MSNKKLKAKILSNLPNGAKYLRHEETSEGKDQVKQYDPKIRVFFEYQGKQKSFVMSSHINSRQ